MSQGASPLSAERAPRTFEIFVGRGFCEYEVCAVSSTLRCANEILGETRFQWRLTSETAGLVAGSHDMIARAEPMVQDHNLSDALIVVGGRSGRLGCWLPRVRQMRRISRPCVLLSDAATSYIAQTKTPSGPVTTHWHQAMSLEETGDHPTLTNALAEESDGVITAAGSGATKELIIRLIAPHLSAADLSELGNRLLIGVVRQTRAEQPKDLASLPALSDTRVKAAVRAMEQSLEAPLNIYELASEIGVSTRHLERMFKDVFKQTPAKFYKQLRTKRARALIEETQMPMIDIAIATGFGSSSSMNDAIKQSYGMTASKMRRGHS